MSAILRVNAEPIIPLTFYSQLIDFIEYNAILQVIFPCIWPSNPLIEQSSFGNLKLFIKSG